jgi:hypothetical protein
MRYYILTDVGSRSLFVSKRNLWQSSTRVSIVKIYGIVTVDD